ncbi:MAG TPA: nuclear transport factor 2 family protein [Bryobacteraceae bacterium]|nr:nuclear transport factor 2 family protein [Bryobacteraceae bacterium]
MKRLTTAILTLGLAAMALAQKPATSDSSVAAQLKQIENDWSAAQKARDTKKLEEILADQWVGIGPDAKTSDKAKAIEDVKAPGNSLDSYEMGPMDVRVFGNTAIVIGSDTEKSKDSGKDTSGKYVWTDVFIKQNGKWKAISSHSTKVPE